MQNTIYTEESVETVYCHAASTWNLDVVAYIIHTSSSNSHNIVSTKTTS